ncbi:25155_t:CDS:2, partial [Racocetra persica]
AWFPTIEENSPILVFFKYFNPDTQSLEGVCYLYFQKFDKVGDIIPILCKKKNFPSHTHLKIYEEITQNIIAEKNPELTFQQSEIQDGDIICFQKALTEQEVQEHTTAGRIYDIPTFYELLVMRVVVQFKPKNKDHKQGPEFEVRMYYNEVSDRNSYESDPLTLRFTTAHPTTGTYKTVIKSTTTQTLSEMLQTNYPLNSANLLYYEMLDINIILSDYGLTDEFLGLNHMDKTGHVGK